MCVCVLGGSRVFIILTEGEGEEVVGLDDPVPHASQQRGEESMRGERSPL